MVPPTLRARALRTLAEAAYTAGDFETSSRAMAESLAEFERIGDERGIAIVRHRLSIGRAARATCLAPATGRGEPRDLQSAPRPEAGGRLPAQPRVDRARRRQPRACGGLNEQSIVLLQRIGHTWLLKGALLESADLSRELGQMQKAEDSAREGLRVAIAPRQAGDGLRDCDARPGLHRGRPAGARGSSVGRIGSRGRAGARRLLGKTSGRGRGDDRPRRPGVRTWARGGPRLSFDEAVEYALRP